MSTPQNFSPQRYEIGGTDPQPGLDTLGDHQNTLAVIEQELHLEVGKRRAIAASLAGLGWRWRETPHLAEHLAWLLSRETDALTAYSLYRAVLATHPERWHLFDWQRDLIGTTPFALLRTAIIDDLSGEGALDVKSEEDKALTALLDMANPEHRALMAEVNWLAGNSAQAGVDTVVSMLQPAASMPEKVAAMRIVQFASDARLEEKAVPALLALFRIERHPGLSLKIADTIVRKHGYRIDLETIAFFIRAWHADQMPASRIAMGSMLFGVEGFLLDKFMEGEQRSSALTDALLAQFSPARLPADGAAIVASLTAISIDGTHPLAAFAATATLQATGHPHAAGAQLVLHMAEREQDPANRAFAIRVLGEQPRALLPLLDTLKALAVAPNTDARVRRSAFHALVNTRQSALPTEAPEVIDLYFQYLTSAPFEHFADAVHGSDVAKAPEHFLVRFAENFDAIKSEAARQAAFNLLAAPFAFGIDTAFQPHWDKVVALMLRALDTPADGDLHYTLFYNLLHDVAVPEGPAALFAEGLKARLARVAYTERSRGLMEAWLSSRGAT